MKRYLAYGSVITVLLLFAVTAFTFRSYQNRMADAAEAFSALDLNKAGDDYDKISQDLSELNLSELFLNRWINKIRDNRNEVRYWQGDYSYLAAMIYDAEIEEEELSMRMEFVGTNALYRSIDAETDKVVVVEELTDIADRYKRIVDNDPDNFDAAFNYEYLVRVIEDVSSGKKELPLGQPGNQMMHGMEGEPIDLEDADQIKIFVPRGDEEDDGDDAGKGEAGRKRG